ncbi:MAG: hypothetical protein J5858_07530 [Lentisphaeria bacterium]|nr:hypothetical protein [Lentisphaeria bacterium]
MTPEESKRLASPEFSAVLAADPVIRELRASLFDRKDLIPAAFDALLLTGGERIGKLPVRPLTPAKWAFLWVVDNPFVTGTEKRISDLDLDIFLFVLACPDLRQMDFPLTRLPVEARDYLLASGLSAEQAAAEIQAVIRNAFSPLAMLPCSDGNPEEVFYDGAWIAWIGSVAVKESGMPYDRVIHELPLSLVCNFYVAWRRRESMDGSKIKRPQNGEILNRITARVNELGKEFLNKDKR